MGDTINWFRLFVRYLILIPVVLNPGKEILYLNDGNTTGTVGEYERSCVISLYHMLLTVGIVQAYPASTTTTNLKLWLPYSQISLYFYYF